MPDSMPGVRRRRVARGRNDEELQECAKRAIREGRTTDLKERFSFLLDPNIAIFHPCNPSRVLMDRRSRLGPCASFWRLRFAAQVSDCSSRFCPS